MAGTASPGVPAWKVVLRLCSLPFTSHVLLFRFVLGLYIFFLFYVVGDHFCPFVPRIESSDNRAMRLQRNRVKAAARRG
jgi:hypothetical protein